MAAVRGSYKGTVGVKCRGQPPADLEQHVGHVPAVVNPVGRERDAGQCRGCGQQVERRDDLQRTTVSDQTGNWGMSKVGEQTAQRGQQ